MEKEIIKEFKAITIFTVVYLIAALIDWNLMGAKGLERIMDMATLFLALQWIKSNLLK
mgnify:CR=1 FL=1